MHNLFNLCSGWFFPESKFAGTSTTGQTFVLKSWCNLLLEYITPEKLISSLQESVASSECISMHFSIEFHTDWPEFLMKYLVCVFVSVLTFVFESIEFLISFDFQYCHIPDAFQIYSSTMCPVDTVHLLLLTFSNQKVLETCHYQRSLVFSLNASYMININFCSYMFQANCPVLIKKSVRQIPEKVAKSRHTLLILPLLNA